LSFNKGEYTIGRQGISIEKNLEASSSEGAILDINELSIIPKSKDMRSEYVGISTKARSCCSSEGIGPLKGGKEHTQSEQLHGRTMM
jgi:hypothetical protein